MTFIHLRIDSHGSSLVHLGEFNEDIPTLSLSTLLQHFYWRGFISFFMKFLTGTPLKLKNIEGAMSPMITFIAISVPIKRPMILYEKNKNYFNHNRLVSIRHTFTLPWFKVDNFKSYHISSPKSLAIFSIFDTEIWEIFHKKHSSVCS